MFEIKPWFPNDDYATSREQRLELESDYKIALVELLDLVAGRGHLQVVCI